MWRIGVLMALAADNLEGESHFKGFVQAMAQAGWIDGRNVKSTHAGAEPPPMRIASRRRNWSRLAPTPFLRPAV